MTRVRASPKCPQSDAIPEALSAESCHLVLAPLSPDCVEKLSRNLESTVGQGEKVSNDPTEAESDSGDSLFITQKPVPEAVRSGRRTRYNLRSSPRDGEESQSDDDDDPLLSASNTGESTTGRGGGRIKSRLPKYSFSFLPERKWKPRSKELFAHQNLSLHNYMMGGFFKCVRELRWSFMTGSDLESFLPTVDAEGENISPLSEEEEEERSGGTDIKVVERKRFAATLKAKCSQPWYAPEKSGGQEKQQRRRRRADNAGQEVSQGRPRKMLHKIRADKARKASLDKASVSRDCGDSSRRVLAERETGDKRATSDILERSETPKTNGRLSRGNETIPVQENEWEEELCGESDATVCEQLELRGSPGERTAKGREASPHVTEPPAEVSHADDLSQTTAAEDEPDSQSLLQSLPDLVRDTDNDRVRRKTGVNDKREQAEGDHERAEEGKCQSEEEPEGLQAEAEETSSLSMCYQAIPLGMWTGDRMELDEEKRTESSAHDEEEEEERHFPDSEQMKNKREKNKSHNVAPEEDGKSDVRLEEDSVLPVTCNRENSGKKKKKKKKRERNVEDVEGVEQVQSSAVPEPLNGAAETRRKKKKRKKEKVANAQEREEEEALNVTSGLTSRGEKKMTDCLESPEDSRETLESGCGEKRKKHKKRLASHGDAQAGAEDGVDVSSTNDVTLQRSTVEKKKKKKKKRRESIFEEADVSYAPDENKTINNADDSQKTKEGPDDQDAEMVSEKKKKKKRESVFEEADVSYAPDENITADNADASRKTKELANDQDAEMVSKKKKKKKKKKSEIFSRNVSEDAAAQSDDSVSARKKEKRGTSSFLVADAEEKDAQTHDGQSSPRSKSVAARARGAEKPAVSAGDLVSESAEITGNFEAPTDGVRKKKRKRKMSTVQEGEERDREQHFSEPPETSDTGVKRKKTRERSESESVTPVERLENAAEAGRSRTDETVLKKEKRKKRKGGTESPRVSGGDAELEGAAPKTCSADARDNKKKRKIKSSHNVLLEGKLRIESAEAETHESQEKEKKERNKPATVPGFTSSSPVLPERSDRIMKNKKAKKRLFNLSEDFLTGWF